MAKFFHRFRRQLLSESRFSRYLLYAVGEIILVVIGILIALQINTWNEERQHNKEENRILVNLKTDLLNDLSQLEVNINSSLDRKANMDTLLTILAEPEKHSTSKFLSLIYPLFYESHFEVNSGTFDESIASGTIKYVKNDSLRQQIFTYYRDAKLSYADKHSLKLMYERILPQFVKTLAPSKDFLSLFLHKPALLPELRLSTVARDEDFYAMLILKNGTEDDQINNWNRIKNMAKTLVTITEKELQKNKQR